MAPSPLIDRYLDAAPKLQYAALISLSLLSLPNLIAYFDGPDWRFTNFQNWTNPPASSWTMFMITTIATSQHERHNGRPRQRQLVAVERTSCILALVGWVFFAILGPTTYLFLIWCFGEDEKVAFFQWGDWVVLFGAFVVFWVPAILRRRILVQDGEKGLRDPAMQDEKEGDVDAV